MQVDKFLECGKPASSTSEKLVLNSKESDIHRTEARSQEKDVTIRASAKTCWVVLVSFASFEQ